MEKGYIAHLFRDKEYGLIRTKGGEEVHFHENCLWGIGFDELREGQEVEFLMQTTRKGLLGFEIRPAPRNNLYEEKKEGAPRDD